MRHGLTRIHCEVEALFIYIAGSDTTASAIKVTMLHILTTPRVYQRLTDDIAVAIQEGNASRPITSAEVKNLPYLQVGTYLTYAIRFHTRGLCRLKVPVHLLF